MNLDKVKEALEKKFTTPLAVGAQRRIVFWYDDDGEFNLWLETLELDGVKILRLEGNYFEVKRTLEKTDTATDTLVYSPKPRPTASENWLLDIELYSSSFSADRASILLDELRVEDFGLKDVIRKNIKFFDNQERLRALQDLRITFTTEEDIELGMLAVACKSKTPNVETMTRRILMESLDGDNNRIFEQVRRYPGEGAFWRIVQEHCGYQSETPTLKKLFTCLLLTATTSQLSPDLKTGWNQYQLPAQHRNNVQVFIDHWMNHKDFTESYEDLAKQVFQDLELQRQMQNWKAVVVIDADTFGYFDQRVISSIVEKLSQGEEDYDTWQSWITRRKASHWYATYEDCYLALEAGIDLFKFKREQAGAFQESSAADMFRRYAKTYFLADQLYRRFSFHQGRVNSDILHGLAERIENLYVNWFVDRLSTKWQNLLQRDLKAQWKISDVKQQSAFFKSVVMDVASDKSKDKAFVIISDALRYEVAEQLARELEQETRSKPTLEPMQGTLPSVTDLGMAVLLPHEQILFSDKGTVVVDGVTASAPNRAKILKAGYERSTVISLPELMDMTKEDARTAIGDSRVIYIYHNTIDHVGDKAATEHKTFEAVADAIDEIKRCVKKICNSLNGTHVLVTADHGFLYQGNALPESDKISSDGYGGIASGRRFILKETDKAIDGTTEISMDHVLGRNSGMSVYVPNANIRFTCPGGMRYVHGGASLQEIVVPLLYHTHMRKESKGAVEVGKVDVDLTNTERKIPNNPYIFNFFQTEKCSPKMLARRLRIAVWDLDDKEEKVSTEETLVAEYDSDRADERTFSIRLTLKNGIENREYYLRMIDNETDLEYKRVLFHVKLGIPTDQFWG